MRNLLTLQISYDPKVVGYSAIISHIASLGGVREIRDAEAKVDEDYLPPQ